MKKRIVLIIFVAVQSIGLLCSWFSHHPYSSASALLWGAGFIALFPGNILGSLLVEKLLWESHLPAPVTDTLTVLTVIAVNSILWFAVVKTYRMIFGRRAKVAVSNESPRFRS